MIKWSPSLMASGLGHLHFSSKSGKHAVLHATNSKEHTISQTPIPPPPSPNMVLRGFPGHQKWSGGWGNHREYNKQGGTLHKEKSMKWTLSGMYCGELSLILSRKWCLTLRHEDPKTHDSCSAVPAGTSANPQMHKAPPVKNTLGLD